MIKCIVFDVGRTLMEYVDMPNVWTEYYRTAFEYANKKLNLAFDADKINRAVEILRSFNPTVNYREKEISPTFIFENIKNELQINVDTQRFISVFFDSFHFKAVIYSDTVEVLKKLNEKGYIIATLTDVATGMPDELHKSYFKELMPFFDMYVSSSSCGFRKPNPKGVFDIAEKFNLKKNEIIFVGDEKKDMKTAENFGCLSVLIDRKNQNNNYGQNFTVHNLTELLNVLQEIGC